MNKGAPIISGEKNQNQNHDKQNKQTKRNLIILKQLHPGNFTILYCIPELHCKQVEVQFSSLYTLLLHQIHRNTCAKQLLIFHCENIFWNYPFSWKEILVPSWTGVKQTGTLLQRYLKIFPWFHAYKVQLCFLHIDTCLFLSIHQTSWEWLKTQKRNNVFSSDYLIICGVRNPAHSRQ